MNFIVAIKPRHLECVADFSEQHDKSVLAIAAITTADAYHSDYAPLAPGGKAGVLSTLTHLQMGYLLQLERSIPEHLISPNASSWKVVRQLPANLSELDRFGP